MNYQQVEDEKVQDEVVQGYFQDHLADMSHKRYGH
jgi:hypothetical protein